jgi:hypothetical protein
MALLASLAAVALLLSPAASRADDDTWQFGSTPSFSSGKYGTDSRTEVLYTPLTARRLFAKGDLTFVLPYTCIRGNGSVTVVNGSPVRQQRLAAAAAAAANDGSTRTTRTTTTTSRSTTGSDAASSAAATSAAPPLTSSCGIGDIIVRGRYYVFEQDGWAVAARAQVKAPAASAERGLGTGRPDEGIGLEISRSFRRGFMAMLDGGYTVIGQPAGVEYDNNWWYDVGVGQNLVGGIVNLSVFFEESRSLVRGFVNARDVLAVVSLASARGWRAQVAGQFGLTDGAPDHGITIGASRRF